MRFYQRSSLFLLSVFILFSSRPAASIPDNCKELDPLPLDVDECLEKNVSWHALPKGEKPVCSGAWEYWVYATCTKEDPACGPATCESYWYYTTWDNKEYKSTTTFDVPDKYRCGNIGVYSFDGNQTSSSPRLSAAPIGIRIPPGGWDCSWEPDYEGANSYCDSRLEQLRPYFDSYDRQLISASFTGPTLLSHDSQNRSTEFRCKFKIRYKQEARVRFCAEWKYPSCELHGPDHCDNAEDEDFVRHYSAHGLTEQELLDNYELSEYHECTTYEFMEASEDRYENLVNRLYNGPWPTQESERQELIDQIVGQLMINIELDNLELSYGHIDEIIALIEEHPGITPSCGQGSAVVGTCGSIEPLDSLLNLCVRLTNRHTQDEGIHIDHLFHTCNSRLADEIEEALVNNTNGCAGEAWLPYIDEAIRIRDFLVGCRKTGGGPGDKIPCDACEIRILQ